MAAVARQGSDGRQGRLDALRGLDAADPAEAVRACRDEQVEADVGGRGAVRDHVARRGLQVVGRQVVVAGHHAALEQAPGVARHARQEIAVGLRQRVLRARRARPAHPPRPDRRERPDGAEEHGGRRVRRVRGEQAGGEQRRTDRGAPVLAHERREAGRRRGLGVGGRRPLEQAAPADEQAPERRADGVGRHERQLQQLGEQPGAACHGPAEIGERLPVEMAIGDVVAARREAGQGAHQRPGRERQGDEEDRHHRRHQARRQAEAEQGERHRRDERAPEVVGHLPAVHRAQAPVARAQQEGQQLPVAAGPAVHPRRGDVGMERGVLDDRDVRDRGAAGDGAFEEVVAQHPAFRQACPEHGVHCMDVKQALAGEGALVEDVLVDLRAGRAVRVDAGLAGEQPVIDGDVFRRGQRRGDVRLQDGVAAIDATPVGTQPRLVVGVRRHADQLAQPAWRQPGVAVERDDVGRIRRDLRRPAEVEEGTGAAFVEQGDELLELAAFALPADPAALARREAARPVQEDEARRPGRIGGIALVQPHRALRRRRVPWPHRRPPSRSAARTAHGLRGWRGSAAAGGGRGAGRCRRSTASPGRRACSDGRRGCRPGMPAAAAGPAWPTR